MQCETDMHKRNANKCEEKYSLFMMPDDSKQILFVATGQKTESNPHIQLIETICNDVLPNMVRIYESQRMNGALDRDQFIKIIEQKVELANKSLKVLPVEERPPYRVKINQAYAINIDRLHEING